MGVLQRLALCYLAAAFVHRAAAGRQEPARMALVLRGAGSRRLRSACPTGSWTPTDGSGSSGHSS
jgi:predicted acyltransferase